MKYKPGYLILYLIAIWTIVLIFIINRFYSSAWLPLKGCSGGDADSQCHGADGTNDLSPDDLPSFIHSTNSTWSNSKLRKAMAILEAEDTLLGQTPAGRTCSQEFGLDMINRWRQTQLNACNGFRNQSHITCYLREPHDTPRLLCTATNSLVQMHSPFYSTKVIESRNSEELQFTGSVLNVDCQLDIYKLLPENWWTYTSSVSTFMNTIDVHKSLPCKQYINHTVFWMMRYDWKNMFHVTEDIVTTYETLLVLNQDPANVELAIYDGFPVKNALFDIWSHIFGRGVRIIRQNPYPVGTCFKKSIVNMSGAKSHLSNGQGVSGHVICSSPILRSMITWIKSMFKEPQSQSGTAGSASPPHKILWISRQHYANRTIGRVIPNEAEILQFIKTKLPINWALEIFRPEELSSMQQQITTMSSARVLIGVHGAGLANLIFLPNNAQSHVIEIFHSDRGEINRHYINICKWLGITHHNAGYFDSSVSATDVWRILEGILETEDAI